MPTPCPRDYEAVSDFNIRMYDEYVRQERLNMPTIRATLSRLTQVPTVQERLAIFCGCSACMLIAHHSRLRTININTVDSVIVWLTDKLALEVANRKAKLSETEATRLAGVRYY